MTTPILITKSPKSVGVAILLTLLFGPVGLFYASIAGGLIMSITPAIIIGMAFIGVLQKSSLLMYWSLGLLVVFMVLYWLINIVWAVIGVLSYNQKIEEESRRQLALWNIQNQSSPNHFVLNINQNTTDLKNNNEESIKLSSKPALQDWLSSNPGKNINDYYIKFRS
jgi:hypothetical protein